MTPRIFSPHEIEERAVRFLAKHHPEHSIPVPIEEIVEIKLRIRVIPSPGLSKNQNIDAFSTRDFEDIYIDKDQLFHRENRARFTLAHEIGHYVLHKQFLKETAFASIEEWKTFIVDDIKRDALEAEANSFAGFLLLPTDILEMEYQKIKQEKLANDAFDDYTLAPYIAKPIARRFEVSEQCAELRTQNGLTPGARPDKIASSFRVKRRLKTGICHGRSE